MKEKNSALNALISICAVFLFAFVASAAIAIEDKPPTWMVKFGKPDINRSSNLVDVCLYHDQATAGFFSAGDWITHLGKNPPSTGCAEILSADLAERVLYLNAYPFERQICYGNEKTDSWTPCHSEFFSVVEVPSQYANVRGFDNKKFREIVVEKAKTIPALEAMIAENTRKAAAEKYAKYRSEYEAITTLPAIADFEQRYAGYDPDGLMEGLGIRREEIQHKQYRDEFTQARTSSDLSRFISTYEKNDQDGLVPEAKKRRAEAIALEEQARKRQQQEKEKEQERIAESYVKNSEGIEYGYLIDKYQSKLGVINRSKHDLTIRARDIVFVTRDGLFRPCSLINPFLQQWAGTYGRLAEELTIKAGKKAVIPVIGCDGSTREATTNQPPIAIRIGKKYIIGNASDEHRLTGISNK